MGCILVPLGGRGTTVESPSRGKYSIRRCIQCGITSTQHGVFLLAKSPKGLGQRSVRWRVGLQFLQPAYMILQPFVGSDHRIADNQVRFSMCYRQATTTAGLLYCRTGTIPATDRSNRLRPERQVDQVSGRMGTGNCDQGCCKKGRWP